MTMKYPALKKGCCSVCGNADLTLAVDRTEYTPVTFKNGAWTRDTPTTELVDGPETIRLFCPDCGEYHTVPKALI
jgi:hypothetical protein